MAARSRSDVIRDNLDRLGLLDWAVQQARRERVTFEALVSTSRNKELSRARRAIISLVHGITGYGPSELARVFQMDRASICYSLAKRENELERSA